MSRCVATILRRERTIVLISHILPEGLVWDRKFDMRKVNRMVQLSEV